MNFVGSGIGKPSPVDAYPPNPWGLHDMHGNLYQACEDAYDKLFAQTGPKDDPLNKEGEFRVTKGGGSGTSRGAARPLSADGKQPWPPRPCPQLLWFARGLQRSNGKIAPVMPGNQTRLENAIGEPPTPDTTSKVESLWMALKAKAAITD